MPRKSSPDTLIVRGLSADDQAWLASESERLGVDPENLVRAMIRQRRGLRVVPAEDETSPQPRVIPFEFTPPTTVPIDPEDLRIMRERMDARAQATPQLALHPDLDDGGIDLSPEAAEPGLDEVMAARPPLFAQKEARPSPWNGPRQRHVAPHRPAPERAVAPPRVLGAISAFTLIKPLGLSERTVRAPMQGDGIGNVMKQNNVWAGFSSGGSRRDNQCANRS
jgi:hypothetical protein